MFEYLIFDVDDDDDAEEISSQLNSFAKEGWRVISGIRTSEVLLVDIRREEILWKIRFILERKQETKEK